MAVDQEPTVGVAGAALRRRPDPSRGGRAAHGRLALRASPGAGNLPYHYEYAEEEWLLALDPGASVRTPDGTQALAPLDLVFFARGPEGAHQVRNDSSAAVRVLMFSEVVHPAATAYVGSRKVGLGRPGRLRHSGDRSSVRVLVSRVRQRQRRHAHCPRRELTP
jgi:uncharacterized cupin superfamily protein